MIDITREWKALVELEPPTKGERHGKHLGCAKYLTRMVRKRLISEELSRKLHDAFCLRFVGWP